MQKLVEKKPAKRPDKPERATIISAARFALLTVPIKQIPGSPLVIHAFSQKAREQMRETQEAGSVGKKKRHREPKDFNELYQNARHISTDGWDGIAAASFRNAMIASCRLVNFKMTVSKMSVFIETDGICASTGSPLVRIHGEPRPFEAMVRNQTGVADVRVRPRWDEWSADLRIRFDLDQFAAEDVINLLVRAGGQNGVGEGRPGSANSFGQGWGLFEIDTTKPVGLHEMARPKIEFVR